MFSPYLKKELPGFRQAEMFSQVCYPGSLAIMAKNPL